MLRSPRGTARSVRLTVLALLAVALLVLSACGTEPDLLDEADTPVAPTPDPVDEEPTEPEPTEPAEAETTVQVYFANTERDDACDAVFAVSRTVREPNVATEALSALLEGPTAAEQAEGYGGWFDDHTAGMLNAVWIEDEIAYADFADFSAIIPNASTSCGSQLLLAQLDNTLMQFPTVTDTRYSFDGDREAFYHWLQLDPPA